MPYIPVGQRPAIDRAVGQLVSAIAAEADELHEQAGLINYAVTRLLVRLLRNNMRYSHIAVITGVLENIKQEFYRRAAEPYEDAKCRENGDVYSPTGGPA